ncbi:hypothetical protein GUK34_28405 [Rhizobium leguminosarum]|uniref:hypothetical protein n=1 Tax=Rhizobium ruizarguesonis TaxID=2081791 RepID=UPI0013B80A86|nr:hypothetical protein [Rhizobium ruizarguesonis]NEI08725.1 hypothetical protein [Rhizobium ruizarguesonis]
MKRIAMLTFTIWTMGTQTTAFADCGDIKQGCWQNYQLDMAACERNYSGQQQADCHARAAQQFSYCVSASGC